MNLCSVSLVYDLLYAACQQVTLCISFLSFCRMVQSGGKMKENQRFLLSIQLQRGLEKYIFIMWCSPQAKVNISLNSHSQPKTNLTHTQVQYVNRHTGHTHTDTHSQCKGTKFQCSVLVNSSDFHDDKLGEADIKSCPHCQDYVPFSLLQHLLSGSEPHKPLLQLKHPHPC